MKFKKILITLLVFTCVFMLTACKKEAKEVCLRPQGKSSPCGHAQNVHRAGIFVVQPLRLQIVFPSLAWRRCRRVANGRPPCTDDKNRI